MSLASRPTDRAFEPPFDSYTLDAAYDEMFAGAGTPRPHYATLYQRLRDVPAAQLRQRQQAADLAFLNQGITFTVYGNDGYMKSDSNIVNSSTVKLDADGRFTVYFGSKETCGDKPNRLDTSEGWNYILRIYRPGPSVLDGSYKLPVPAPVG